MSAPTNSNLSTGVNEILARVRANDGRNVDRNSPQWEAAREAVLAEMNSNENMNISTPTTMSRGTSKTGGRRGRGGRRGGSPIAHGTIRVHTIADVGEVSSPPNGRAGGARRGNRGGRPRGSRAARGSIRGGKRKRASEDDEERDEKDDTDASETFTPLPTQSRSGRKIFQAATNIPIIRIDDQDPAPSPSLGVPVSTGAIRGKRKGRCRRPPGAAAVCKNCGRGHSPASNVIVFCDGCNKPWHQYCHDPPIRGDMAQIEEKEWFCADCTVLREEKDQLEGKVSGEGISLVEKRAYLLTLPQPTLVSLLLHASNLHPDLPIFAPPTSAPAPIPSLPLSAPKDPIYHSPYTPSPSVPEPEPEPEPEELETYYEEEELLPYPKPGNGIQLPPESEDLAFLIDTDTVAFSHAIWPGGSRVVSGVGEGEGEEWRMGVREVRNGEVRVAA